MASSGLKKMLDFIILYIPKGVSENVYLSNLYLRVNNPSLNRSIGKYHVPRIWDEVLFNTSELKLK